jgi:TonB family protein
MFNNLIESESHKEDYKRKASFFIYTLAVYAVLALAGGLASIYAYDAHLESQSLEFITLVAPAAYQPPTRAETPRASASASENNRLPERTELIARINDSTRPPETVSAARTTTPEMPPGPVAVTGRNLDVTPFVGVGGPSIPGSGSGSRNNGTVVRVDDNTGPPPLRTTPTPTPKKQPVNKGIINSQAISLPKPPYPPLAKTVGASGTVIVQILLDESGKVISARAISGHPLLQAAAVKAAYQARFSPTLLSNEPVKVSGMITYNFVAQ